jgi:general secretion pathway protein F
MSGGEKEPRWPGAITIDQLLALNQEIVALVRAGVPLERGLLLASGDLRGRLRAVAGALGRRLSRGESLAQAMESERRSVPPLYRAVVEAGARSGRLPVALEGLARYVRGYSDARATIGLALWYPLLVLALAYALFIALVSLALPRFIHTFELLGMSASAPVRWLALLSDSVGYWWPVGPILLVVLAIAWASSGRAARFQSPSWSWLHVFPWMRSMLANYETANFSELLALLLEHHVPLPTALELAAEATGNSRMTRGAAQLAEAIERGEPAAAALERIDRRTFLPMLRWALAGGGAFGSLAGSLNNLAGLYRKRAKYQAEKLAVFLPTILLIVIGASATLFYALALILPLVNLLKELTVS